MSPVFVLRWSLRDLRHKWIQVAAIALVIAIGTGLYSSLSGTSVWRRVSNDASFAAAGMYDLRVRSTEGLDAPQGAMLAVLDGLNDGSVVRDAEERLVVGTQVDASAGNQTILVPGRIVGLDVADGGPALTKAVVGDGDGRILNDGDDGRPRAVLERNFAEFYGLDAGSTLRLGGGAVASVDVVGIGMAPEYFYVTAEEGGLFAEANFAAVFMPLTTAQQLSQRPGRVNDLVISLRAGSDTEAVQAEVQQLFDESTIGLGVTVMTRDDDTTYRLLYDDIESDARFWRIFAALILGGAALGAFNLSARMVEAQRRELGIGMALGSTRRQLAVRPMLVGLETAIASVVLGIGVGTLSVALIRPIYAAALPMPVWITDFQWMPFARGAALGFAIPLAASAWPVWRAVRMTPVDAISTVHRNSRSGMSTLLRRLPWPRSAFRRMPLGNVLRTPRRTLLTAVGLGATIATLVAILGMIDSFTGTMFGNEAEVLGEHPDRVVVALRSVVLEDAEVVAAVKGSASVGEVSPVLQVGARLAPATSASTSDVAGAGSEGFDVVLEALDLDGGVWHPTASGDVTRPGIVIAQSAADDLGVSVGGTVALMHPVRTAYGFTTTTSEVEVVGIHPSPFRFSAYVDRSMLSAFGADRLANELFVVPAAGATAADVQRELFDLQGVGSAVPARASIDILRGTLREFTGIFRIAEAFMLLLALAMTYNTTSINADERARERATLFAFGLPVTRVVVLEVGEGLLYGVLGTAIGLGVGAGITDWLMTSVWRSTMPDMALDTIISGTTVATAVVLGVVAVSVAPLLTMRRLLRMDVPSTLRVVE
ncbi:MAG: hypothetical protein RJB61_1003 [Actinomycetota bacterium]